MSRHSGAPCRVAILVGTNRATNDALDAIGRRWLNLERAATCLQLRGQPIVVARLRDGVVAEPRPERRDVGKGRLAEVEEGADFGPCRSTFPRPQSDRQARCNIPAMPHIPIYLLDRETEDATTGCHRQGLSVARASSSHSSANRIQKALCFGFRAVAASCRQPSACRRKSSASLTHSAGAAERVCGPGTPSKLFMVPFLRIQNARRVALVAEVVTIRAEE
jgi:hypothetical protein